MKKLWLKFYYSNLFDYVFRVFMIATTVFLLYFLLDLFINFKLIEVTVNKYGVKNIMKFFNCYNSFVIFAILIGFYLWRKK